MATDNETVEEIVKRVRRECNSYPLPTAAAEMLKLVREFQAAHKREMNHRAIIAGVSLADAVDDEHKREIGAKDAEIAELRRRLKVAEDALDSAWMYADKLPHQWPLPERVRTKMKNALAAIRREGGAE